MAKISNEEELINKYNEFIKTEAGQKWKKDWQENSCKDNTTNPNPGDFGDYLYDFYPELLM